MAAGESTYILEKKTVVSPTSPPQERDNESFGSTHDVKQLILDEPVGKSTETSNLHQTGFNYINSIIGSGIVGIPYAINQAGFVLGLLLLPIIAIATDYSLCILVKGGNIVGVSTYQDLVQAAFGKPGFYFLTLIQFIYPFIAMISYNIIIGDTITKVLMRIFGVSRNTVLGNRHFVVFFVTVCVTLPLSLYRNISRLSKVSLVSLLFAVFILIFVLVRASTLAGIVPATSNAYSFANWGITDAIGVIAFAFMCHHNSFLLYDALENPTQGRWNRITHISMGLSFILILVFGIGGYVTFTGFSQGDLLENYCMTDDYANAARILFTITIMLTYPIECFVTREVFENAFFANHQPSSTLRHAIVTVVIVFLTFALSILTDCLGIVLQLNGILAAVPLAYILPAATYLKVQQERILSWDKTPAFLLVFFGIIVAVCGTAKTVINISNGITCSHGEEMPYCLPPFIPTNISNVYNLSTINDLS
ncbi:putative sodium-coupled neutral amino acid transporter 11 [Centruroides sculpturatus]|uniref:putative sodium-coupled neutral amino acid transporter 11 n=1 Tax=Centruroides sculpturatus TaxID=218467 RepID=UPI000C6EF99B|nr:putative sodium-coupled neutral amino acid transporter 11 [Centruroides sculpturatus]